MSRKSSLPMAQYHFVNPNTIQQTQAVLQKMMVAVLLRKDSQKGEGKNDW